MATIYIFHGLGGNPQENWFPWLKQKLELLGHKVIIPSFPDSSHPQLKAWLQKVESFSFQNTVLIGHSLGVPFILNILEKKKEKAAFLVAGFCTPLGLSLDELVKTFLSPFDYGKIKSNCASFTLINSTDDPYITVAKAKELAKNLNTHLTLLNNSGHFNQKEFPFLLERIKELL